MYDRSVSLKLRPPQACGFLNGRTGRIVESDELVGSTLMSNKILTRGVSVLVGKVTENSGTFMTVISLHSHYLIVIISITCMRRK